jgi:hypothetical protein
MLFSYFHLFERHCLADWDKNGKIKIKYWRNRPWHCGLRWTGSGHEKQYSSFIKHKFFDYVSKYQFLRTTLRHGIYLVRRNVAHSCPLRTSGCGWSPSWRCTQCVPPKHWYASTSPRGIATKKYNMDIFALRTLTLTITKLYSSCRVFYRSAMCKSTTLVSGLLTWTLDCCSLLRFFFISMADLTPLSLRIP